MKTTDHFKRTIQMYLEQRAAEDALFAKNYCNPAKNIDDCVTYILNYVQKSGCNGFTDGEIYGQAVHYYDENEIEVGKPIQCQIAVNHVVELTAEEKAEARQNAIRQYQEEEVRKLQNRNKSRTATKATTQEVQQPSLFDIHTEASPFFNSLVFLIKKTTLNVFRFIFPCFLVANIGIRQRFSDTQNIAN